MAQEIILSTDSPSTSIGDINANFTELYTNKIEATQTVALTNKTIDADLNTITDLTPTNIKTGNKTGLDTFVVTGTKGDADELAKWNSDGDLVSTDVSITTSQPSSTSLDTTIPTSKAVYDYMSAQVDVKQVYVPALYNNAAATQNPNSSLLSPFPYTSINATQTIYFNFAVPENYSALVSAELIMIPDATETLTFTDVTVNTIADGQVYTGTTVSTGSFTQAVTVNTMTFVELSTRTNLPFTDMVAGDIVGVSVQSGTTLMRILGLLIKYS